MSQRSNSGFRRFTLFRGWLAALTAGLCLLSCVLNCLGQESRPPFLHQIWRSEEGLPGAAVFSILQSRDGYLWATTSEGIVRFDGTQFVQVLRSRVSAGEPEPQLALTQSRDGSIWGCASNGLARILNGQATLYTTQDGLPADRVLSVFEDSSGTIWIGSVKGLAQLGVTGGILPCPNKIASLQTAVRAIVQDKSGVLWFGTDKGLIELRNGNPTLHSRNEALRDRVRSLCASRDGGLWVGSEGGLGYFKNGTWREIPALSAMPQGFRVNTLYEKPSGALWIGGSRGLLRLAGGTIRVPATSGPSALESGNVVPGIGYAFCQDNEGNLWVGTSAGLSRLRTPNYSLFDQGSGLPESATAAVLQTHDGSVWMGTRNGWLSRLRKGKLTNWQLAKSAIAALCEDQNGTLWAGTEEEGLFGFPGGEPTGSNTQGAVLHYSAGQNGLLDNNVGVLYQDHKGALWVGSSNGLCQLRGGKFCAYPGLSQIRAIAEDASTNLWIGSQLALTCVSNGQFHTYGKLTAIPRTSINALCAEPDGALWVGCDNGDLLRYKKGVFKRYGLSPDLFARVQHLSKDNAGNLWIAAHNGIFRISTQQAEYYADKGRGFVDCIKLDGSQREQCAGTGQPGIEKTSDGRMWFAGTAGTLVVNPKTLGPKSQPPAVVIEEVLFDGQPITPGAHLTRRSAGSSSLEVHYSALSLRTPGDLLFRCQLKGREDWRDMGGRRVVRYDNLPTGSYTFQVAARSGQGVWNAEGASFSFRISPPFYRSYPFYAAALVVFGGLIFLGARLRLRHLRRLQEQLERLVEERTRTLQQEIAEHKRTEQALLESQHMVFRQERLATVGQLAAGIAHEFNNILTIIQGNTELLLQNSTLSSDDVQSLTDISTSVERSAKLTRQMLAFSRKQIMQRQLIDINGSLRQTTRMLDRVLGEDILFRCDFAPTLPAINVDITMIEQVLMNLAVNARDAMPRGGSLIIQTAVVAVAFSEPEMRAHPERRAGQFVCLSVSDTGCGMDEKTLKHIFEPFFTTKEAGKGTGLGLATVYGLVSQHQGWIDVTSQPGKGTTFKVYLPIAEKS